VTETTLTTKGKATRQRIIDAAAAHIRTHGVADTSLDDIRRATATSKSQLFHYFPGGKSQLLLAVARHEADRVIADQQPYLDELTTWKQWGQWRQVVVERYRQQGQHCPLSALLSELGRADPDTRAVVVDLLGRWQASIATGVRAMQASGKVDSGIDPDRSGAALLAGIQGGVTMMLATGDITPLEAALELGIDQLRRPGAAR
jgi:AcrR family transcriptional regulator